MLSSQNKDDLKKKGYTVVHDVLTTEEADGFRGEYEGWLSQFEKGTFPHTNKSLIQRYRVGHMEPTWTVRLKSKHVFSQIWNTDELLTSFDAIAIGRPPEDGDEDFFRPGHHWLHCDQRPARVGLHAYQGAVYLEECQEDDWAFEVLEGSHDLFAAFYESEHVKKTLRLKPHWRLRTLRDEDLTWYVENGCVRKRIPVPKGGMVLWDSRLIHANSRPVKEREHPGRWRYLVFVCMTPAAWADEESLKQKREAYENLKMTTHWPSDDIGFFSEELPSYAEKKVKIPQELPAIAKTAMAKRLAGVLTYDASGCESRSSCPPKPEWEAGRLEVVRNQEVEWETQLAAYKHETSVFYYRRVFAASILALLLSGLFYVLM
ncbi:uncharacterized protein LOC121390563 [Gigantopelta aegis]|uniref:uncharacterized protein LOC121390563 n=1 Tax=Gigantopelta aegis TaxID=1735272 RepID=UPI001B888965|nr:uncharacterized protein LOC121390563 [Gigantopelta aegis]